MTLKNRISLLVSLLFTVLFGLASTFIFILYANFRKQEFKDRLEIKALTTIKLLANIKDTDYKLLKLIDKNAIDQLHDEKTLIFDAHFTLIYSSLDDVKIKWSVADLNYLKKNKTFFKNQNGNEFYGILFKKNAKSYYVLISANDSYGNRKLVYLQYVLIISYLVFTILCWILTSFTVNKTMRPLGILHQKIKNINENNLDTRIVVKSNKNELDLIAREFNFMMSRIEVSYQKQKEFTAHASHELRTPLARLMAQIENKTTAGKLDADTKIFLNSLLTDVVQLTELINSLLILSRIDNKKIELKKNHRIDEIIFSAIEKVNKIHPDFVIHFDIIDSLNMDSLLEIKGNKSLLEIAFTNVLKNACTYSNNNQCKILLLAENDVLKILIFNTGETIDNQEQTKLFEPFFRGKNAVEKSGFGLGLRIVQRILTLHFANIAYTIPEKELNLFTITFHL